MPNETTQGPAPTPFPFRPTEVTSPHISGGTWYNIEGNSLTFHGCNVFMTSDGQTVRTVPLSSTRPGSAPKRDVSRRVGCDSSDRAKESCARGFPSGRTRTSHPSVSQMPPRFLAATTTLKNINELIAPHTDAIGIFKRIEPLLRDLEILVGFASAAYTACGSGTLLGSFVKMVIDARMEQCNRGLSHLLVRIARSPYRSFPRAGYAYCVVHEWWTANELEEISTIRLSISEEVTAIGEWLRCLHSFWWASSQLLTTGSNFTMETLREFLESGPISMLGQIVVEEITFLEPLQGERRSIPIQFLETVEDVHMAIGMACQGTAASRFIKQRRYQLDESTTDATLSEEDLLQHIDRYRVFEITIKFSKLELLANVCPRCEKSHKGSNQKSGSGWLRCDQCGTKFNAYTPMPTVTEEEERETTQIFQGDDSQISAEDKQYEDDEIDNDEQLWASDVKMAKLFRRIKFEVKHRLGELVPPESSYNGSFQNPHFVYSSNPNLAVGGGVEVFPLGMPDLNWIDLARRS